MQFQVFFINKAFKDVFDVSTINDLLSREQDDFKKKQVRNFFNQPEFSQLVADAKRYFAGRDDIMYAENEIILNNRIAGKISRLMLIDDEIILIDKDGDTPLLTFMHSRYRSIIAVKKARQLPCCLN